MVVITPYGWYTWVFGAAAIVLPYIAVVLANVESGRATRRMPRTRNARSRRPRRPAVVGRRRRSGAAHRGDPRDRRASRRLGRPGVSSGHDATSGVHAGQEPANCSRAGCRAAGALAHRVAQPADPLRRPPQDLGGVRRAPRLPARLPRRARIPGRGRSADTARAGHPDERTRREPASVRARGGALDDLHRRRHRVRGRVRASCRTGSSRATPTAAEQLALVARNYDAEPVALDERSSRREPTSTRPTSGARSRSRASTSPTSSCSCAIARTAAPPPSRCWCRSASTTAGCCWSTAAGSPPGEDQPLPDADPRTPGGRGHGHRAPAPRGAAAGVGSFRARRPGSHDQSRTRRRDDRARCRGRSSSSAPTA